MHLFLFLYMLELLLVKYLNLKGLSYNLTNSRLFHPSHNINYISLLKSHDQYFKMYMFIFY